MRIFVGLFASALLLLVAAVGIGLIWSHTPTARTSWHTEGVYSGYFVSGFERSTFVPVGSNERWYLTGRAAGRTDISTGDWMYIEVRATLSEVGTATTGGTSVRQRRLA